MKWALLALMHIKLGSLKLKRLRMARLFSMPYSNSQVPHVHNDMADIIDVNANYRYFERVPV